MTQRPTLILSGMIAADPHQGGATWAVLQYLLGFERLGWDVYFIEPIAGSKLKPDGATLRESDNAKYFLSVVKTFGLAGRCALVLQGSDETVGLPYRELCDISSDAQVLINIAGVLTIPDLRDPPPIRIYLDLDPAFVQIWNAQGIDLRFGDHTHFVTVGQAIGTHGNMIPTDGKRWLHTLPPVVMKRWPLTDWKPTLGLTTVGNWRAYGSITYQGHFLGQKVHSIRPIMTLPKQLGEPITLAMSIDPSESKDLAELNAGGWKFADPTLACGTPQDYQTFIGRSKGEIGITKLGYIVSRSGWFSDRSACYLASGRPVIAQETGWSGTLPTGKGLFSFKTPDEAALAVAEINANPELHRQAARDVASEYLDSDKVLGRLLSIVGAT